MQLDELRNNIDEIDAEILQLLNKRFTYVQEVGKWKLSRSHEIYVPEREKALLLRLEKLNTGPLQTKSLRAIYREIMSGAIALENPIEIVCPGNNLSLPHCTAQSKFGAAAKYITGKCIKSVFNDVESKRANYGIVPVESSVSGIINETFDNFMTSDVQICAEINIYSHFNLISKGDINNLRIVYSTPENIGLCSNWIKENLPGATIESLESIELAISRSQNNENSAIIIHSQTPRISNYTMIAQNIENDSTSVTRFVVIGRQFPKQTGDDKTSICYFLNKEKTGIICDILEPFKKNNIPVTMIESRPSHKKNWEYYFFIDYSGHINDANFKVAMKSLEDIKLNLKILGSYPRSDDIL